jgi:hypothetical protein
VHGDGVSRVLNQAHPAEIPAAGIRHRKDAECNGVGPSEKDSGCEARLRFAILQVPQVQGHCLEEEER